LISPLNAYVVLTLTFCRRWVPDFRLGSLLALMLPLSIAFFLGGRRPDGDLGSARNPGGTRRGSVVRTARSGTLNGLG
jgi:AbgT putative transporter family